MHPMISLFPNKEFYNKKILDGPNVKERSYKKQFLKGKMFGQYSFIHLAQGEVEFDETKSKKNMVEVAVVIELVTKLHKGIIFIATFCKLLHVLTFIDLLYIIYRIYHEKPKD